jgi:hypothetical protein
MAKPAPKTALSKAPGRVHPVAPSPAEQAAQPADAPDMVRAPESAPQAPAATAEPPAPSLAMFSVRMDPVLRRRVKRYAAERDTSLQDVAAAALHEYLERHSG